VTICDNCLEPCDLNDEDESECCWASYSYSTRQDYLEASRDWDTEIQDQLDREQDEEMV
jgi:hypothetical protein